MERLAVVGLHFGIVLIFMKDEEVDSISANDSVNDLISGITWFTYNLAGNRIPVLA